jgi:16S rRNA processing protein RimM
MSDHTTAPADLVELGRITSAYGLKGWVRIQPHSARAEVLLNTTLWWLRAPQAPVQRADILLQPRAVKVQSVRFQGSALVAQLDISSDRDAAEALKGCSVWAQRSSFPAVSDGEYYWVDLVGCQLFGEADGSPVLIGQVAEVIDNGAHAVLRVERVRAGEQGPELLRDGKGRVIDVLVPFVKAHVYAVDIANKRLDSNWPAEF